MRCHLTVAITIGFQMLLMSACGQTVPSASEEITLDQLAEELHKCRQTQDATKGLRSLWLFPRYLLDYDDSKEAGQLFLETGDHIRAKRYFKIALDKNPASPMNNHAMGLCHYRCGQYLQAAQRWLYAEQVGCRKPNLSLQIAKALSLAGAYGGRARIVTITDKQDKLPRLDGKDLIGFALPGRPYEYTAFGPDSTVYHATRYLQSHPDAVEARLLLAQSWAALGRQKEALEEIRSILDKTPASSRMHLEAMDLSIRMALLAGDLKTAQQQLSKIEKDPAYKDRAIETHREVAQGYLDSGRAAQAIPHLQWALNHQPEDVQTIYLLGEAWNATGEREKARKAYSKVLEINPQHRDRIRLLSMIENLEVKS